MKLLVLDSLFVNLCILSTGLFVFHLLFHRIRAKLNASQTKILIGVTQGLFGILLMRYGIPLPENVLIDLRIIPVMVAAQVGGLMSSCIAVGVIICARLALSPYSASALLNAIVLLVAGVSFGVIARREVKHSYKWSIMALIFAVILGLSVGIVIHPWKRALAIVVQYAISVVVATYVAQVRLSYMWKSNEAFDRLKDMAETDHLTRLHNTRSFDRELERAYLRSKANGESLSLLSMDIDHFKQINDTYGHPAGDEVLRQIAQILLNNCRAADIVCRNGGEEFAVILPRCDRSLARHVAERIRTAVDEHIFVLNEATTIHVTVSIGLTTVTDFTRASINELIRTTDEGLYMAKRAGRNQIYLT